MSQNELVVELALDARTVDVIVRHLRARSDNTCASFGREPCPHALAIAAQIEARIKPPRPAEPRNLGAVVEEADGTRWVYIDGQGERRWANRDSVAEYRNLDAVKVLSEGVIA